MLMRLSVSVSVGLAAVLAAVWVPIVASASEAQIKDVDVELVLMVDVSLSMSPAELEIQRRGYAEAIASDEVIAAIGSGFLGGIALTYVEWAGAGTHRVVVDWRQLSSREDALGFARALGETFPIGRRRTSISSALLAAAEMIDTNSFRGTRAVIDISGDGPNNQGSPVRQVRDMLLARGIIINGLPLMTRDGLYTRYDIDNLDAYYRECVTGGPGSFVLPVYDWSAFPAAIKRKRVLELVERPIAIPVPLAPIPVTAEVVDCMIGEKMWENLRGTIGLP